MLRPLEEEREEEREEREGERGERKRERREKERERRRDVSDDGNVLAQQLNCIISCN